MSANDPVIVSFGLVTGVGLTAGENAASIRAAMARFVETRLHDRSLEPFVCCEVPSDGLPPLENLAGHGVFRVRDGRLLRLAALALAECTKSLPPNARRWPLILSLPEIDGSRPTDAAAFLARLALQSRGAFDPHSSQAAHRGRAGGVAALGYAADLVRGGHAPAVIAGAADTYLDQYVLGTLDVERRVKSPSNGDGLVPGEGAGFVALSTEEFATSNGLTPIARLSPASRAFEPGHLYSNDPYQGEGLATAVAQLVQGSAVLTPFQEVYSSMNGERHWAKEWGVARLRNGSHFADSHGMHHPSDCFGDVGAAIGPAMAILAALGIRSGHRRSPALVYASSDRGERAALAVSQA